MAPISHLVSFKLKSEDDVKDLYDKFLALQHKCVGKDGKEYIINLRGGKQISPEGFDKGMQHVFMMEFENDEDRQYYLFTDPAHDEFKKWVPSIVADVVVLDFVAGQK